MGTSRPVTCMGDINGMHTAEMDQCSKMSKGGFVQWVCRDHIQYWQHLGWNYLPEPR